MPLETDMTLEELRAERDFSEALVETTQALVCVFDAAGRIVRFNRACEDATGYTRGEVLGRDAREFVIPPEEREAFGAVLADVWATLAPSPQRGHWSTRGGERIVVDWANRPLVDEEGRVTHLVATGLDITERERATAELVRLADEQAALRRVATLVAGAPQPERVFEAVAAEAGRLLSARSAATIRFDDAVATTVGRWGEGDRGGFDVGTTVPLEGDGLTAIVARTGALARIDDYAGVAGPAGEMMRTRGYRSAIAAPIAVAGRTWGAVLVASSAPDPFAPGAEQRLDDFADLVAVAVESAQARGELAASRARIVEAAVEERRRLERDLHDGAQQRLVALALGLRLAQARLEEDPAGARELLCSAAEECQQALGELRELARGLHPAFLADRGLPAALDMLGGRAPFPVVLAGVPAERLPASLELAVYFLVAEALTNAAKYAEATRASVTMSTASGLVRVEVADDGRGGADAALGTGLRGLADRVEALGGSLEVESRPGCGTTLRAQLPLGVACDAAAPVCTVGCPGR